MTWKPVGRGSGRRLIDWLKTDEWKHVALSSRIKEAASPPAMGRVSDGRLWIRSDGGRVAGALFVSRFGVVLPAFEVLEENGDGREFLEKIFESRLDRLFSIIGLESRVRGVEALAKVPIRDAESYRMLTLEETPAAAEIDPPLVVRKADAADFEILWPLERGYQIEEVLRKGSRLDELFAKRRFLEALRNHVVYCALRDGAAVAKAQTNARGWTYEQIGGVYVDPSHRNTGLARAVMGFLVSDILSRGPRACLFVKETNLPALHLYRNLGFRDRGPFRITYY